MTIVEKIHNEFDTAQIKILAEAQEIIAENTPKVKLGEEEEKVTNQSSRLRALGFNKVPIVKKAREILERRQKAKTILDNSVDLANIVLDYRETYPFLKFLTEEELDRICDKYNLIHAPVKSYIKDIPNKNLLDIENAQKVQSQHTPENSYIVTPENRCVADFNKAMKLLGKDTPSFTQKEHTKIEQSVTHKKGRYENCFFGEEYPSLFLYNFKSKHNLSFSLRHYHSVDRSGLFIAAPKSHFDLADLKKESKFGFFKVEEVEVEDPIVFRYVVGGIQVLTKWGDEAEDPNLILPIEN